VTVPSWHLITNRKSDRVRLRLSVSISMMSAIEGGRIASRVIDSRAAPSVDRPCPRAMAASMEAFGKPAANVSMCRKNTEGALPHHVPFFAVAIATASRGLVSGSPP